MRNGMKAVLCNFWKHIEKRNCPTLFVAFANDIVNGNQPDTRLCGPCTALALQLSCYSSFSSSFS